MSEEVDHQRPGASRAQRKNWYGDAQAWTNAERWSDGNIRGLNQRPWDALTDEKNNMFADIRAVPWKLNLAVEICHFARSDDISSSVWPYERFETRLAKAGTPVPDGMSIAQAVDVVLSDLDHLSRPRTKGSMAKGTWYEKNIARPLSDRFAAASLGVGSFSELESDESGVAHVYSSASRGPNDPSPWADWLRGRTKDMDLETLSVLHLDVLRSPTVLRAELNACEERLNALRDALGQQDPSESEEAPAAHIEAEALNTRIDILRMALALATKMADRSATLEEFRTLLQRLSDASAEDFETTGTKRKAPAPALTRLLVAEGQSTLPDSEDAYVPIRAAALYAQTLGIARTDTVSNQEST